MLEAAKKLEALFPGLSFMIATPNEQIQGIVKGRVFQCRDKPSRLNVVCGHARESMRQAEAAIVTSGTATLETALIGTPHILVYKTSALTFFIGRRLVKISHVGLVNILANRTVCPELLQNDATPDALATATAKLMAATPERKAMVEGYTEIRQLLGTESAAKNVARILCDA